MEKAFCRNNNVNVIINAVQFNEKKALSGQAKIAILFADH